jgi:VanZ family protein
MARTEVVDQTRSDRSVGGAPHSDKKLSWFPASKKLIRAVWLAAILAVIVGSALPSESRTIQALERIPLSDKVEHVAMYAVLAFLPAIHERRRVVIGIAFGAILLGVGLEFLQLMTGWRDFEVADMIADAIGVCLGLALGAAVRARARVY